MGDYEIRVYTPELMPQALKVLQVLWGVDVETNQAYFQWKYPDNPYVDRPFGIIALSHNTVVGFRGYFATHYAVPGQPQPMLVLVPGDTCVHPDHRRQGLSVKMGRLAMETFAEVSPLFLNMTATQKSLPGYLKMGFQPIAPKVYVSAYSLPGLLMYLATYTHRPRQPTLTLQSGTTTNISLSTRAQPEAMAGIIAAQAQAGRNIALVQDEAFFQWRFANPRKRYLFYYYHESRRITGYVALGLSPNMRRGYVLDCADIDGTSVAKLFRHIMKQGDLNILSIYQFSLDERLTRSLDRVRLKRKGLLRWIERHKTGELPLLIRPVKTKYKEGDWFFGDYDLRNINHWQIKEIGSDAV